MTADNLGLPRYRMLREPRDQDAEHRPARRARRGDCTSFYSASPTCTVSRASLLTGRYPQRHGLTPPVAHQRRSLARREPRRRASGTARRCFPSCSSHKATPRPVLASGTSDLSREAGPPSGVLTSFSDMPRATWTTTRTSTRGETTSIGEPSRPRRMATAPIFLPRPACDFLRRKGQRAVLPVSPVQRRSLPRAFEQEAGASRASGRPPDESFAKYGYSPDTLDVPPALPGDGHGAGRGNRSRARPDRLPGAQRNTLVIFFSDNGAFAAQMSCASNKPYRTESAMIYEGSIRVCCLVRWSGPDHAGNRVRRNPGEPRSLPHDSQGGRARQRPAIARSTAAIPPPCSPARRPRPISRSSGNTTATAPSGEAGISSSSRGPASRGSFTTWRPIRRNQEPGRRGTQTCGRARARIRTMGRGRSRSRRAECNLILKRGRPKTICDAGGVRSCTRELPF